MEQERYKVFLTTGQAADLVGAHESSIKRWCDAGDLSFSLTSGGHRRIALNALLVFADERGPPCPLLGFRSWAGDVWRGLYQALSNKRYDGLTDLLFQWLRQGRSVLPGQLFEFVCDEGLPMPVLFDEVVSPVLYRIGRDWECGDLEVGDEHIMSSLLLDSLHRLRFAVLSRTPAAGEEKPVALVACGEDSLHDFGAHMLQILLEAKGWQVVLLGGRTPVEDLAVQQERFGATLVGVSLMPPHVGADMIRMVEKLSRFYSNGKPYRLVFGGQSVHGAPPLKTREYPFAELCVFTRMTAFHDWLQPLTSVPSSLKCI